MDRIALPSGRPLTEIIAQRYSCRAYGTTPIAPEQSRALAAFAATMVRGLLGTPLRCELAVALAQDSDALHGLGTYGLIKNPAGFIIGAAGQGAHNLEDFGYAFELTARERGLKGRWVVDDQQAIGGGEAAEYIVTWMSETC
jgi:hypothetical protein